MRILIDIGHPAHVHYFKNFTWLMQEKGHEIRFVARDKEMTFNLLNSYGFEFINRGKGGKGLWGKMFYLLKGDLILIKAVLKTKPDIILSFASTYAAHAAWICGKPHIALDDTEHSKLELLLYPPFTKFILTPKYFTRDLGAKHIRFSAFMEQFYLHRTYFKPNQSIFDLLSIKKGDAFAIVRFVSWGASHDIGVDRLTDEDKISLVEKLALSMKVFISSEYELPLKLKCYQLNIPFQLIHDALFYASIYVGEGATTASESAILGTPAVYLNKLTAGTIEREKKVGILKQCTTLSDAQKAIDYFNELDSLELEKLHKELLAETVNPTEFLVSFILNFHNHN